MNECSIDDTFVARALSLANPTGLIYFVMPDVLNAYADASGDDTAKDVVLAPCGCLSTDVKWDAFKKDWEAYLKKTGFKPDPRTKRYVFHATDFFDRNNTALTERRKQIINQDLLSIIREHTVYRFGRVMLLSGFREAEKELPYMRELVVSEPGAFLAHEFFRANSDWAVQAGYETAISYMFDRGDAFYGHVTHGYNLAKQILNSMTWGEGEYLTVSSIAEGNKATHIGLQAADLIAWHTRRYVAKTNPSHFRTKGLANASRPNFEMASLVSDGRGAFKVYGKDAVMQAARERIAETLHRMNNKEVADLLFDESRTKEQNVALLRGIIEAHKEGKDAADKASQTKRKRNEKEA